ncbi:hypothetical protein KUTeg_008520 [Tegillarca granosa]|uniref:CS domain-containing protein n=1 Tax=Tegillarca granosa TaxID=220873 RepID=A0ABQ9F9D0_TEGGR|nr:hypothetical protein KUTeg_008520 [Tegillarca granosa]
MQDGGSPTQEPTNYAFANKKQRHIPAPPVMWAQRKDKIYLTINLEDCKKPKIELTETQLYFRCKGGTDNTDHEVTIKFYKPVIPEMMQSMGGMGGAGMGGMGDMAGLDDQKDLSDSDDDELPDLE